LAQQQYIDLFEKKQLPIRDWALYYDVYTPQSDEVNQKYPLIIALHGMENQGAHPDKFMEYAGAIMWGWVTPTVQDKYPCYVVAPHFTIKDLDPQPTRGWITPETLDALELLMKKMINEESVDPNRIYVTGHSLGGGSTWAYPVYLMDYFAAILPTSYASFDPIIETDQAKDIYSKMPIWSVIHRNDGSGGKGSREFIESLKNPFISTDYYGEQEILLSNDRIENLIDAHENYFHTEYGYPCGGENQLGCHFAMDSVIADKLIHKWLFQQYKQKPGALSATVDQVNDEVTVNWQVDNEDDHVQVWFKRDSEDEWIYGNRSSAKLGMFQFRTLKADNVQIRVLLENSKGFVYDRFETTLQLNPLGTVKQELEIFPNPANDELFVRGNTINPSIEISIHSVLGKKFSIPYTKRLSATVLDISSLKSGVYLLRINNETFKVIKN
ncbi:MAG: T9SS type A sorting domain-containing protein, partial [Bacteroidota bacterium]